MHLKFEISVLGKHNPKTCEDASNVARLLTKGRVLTSSSLRDLP